MHIRPEHQRDNGRKKSYAVYRGAFTTGTTPASEQRALHNMYRLFLFTLAATICVFDVSGSMAADWLRFRGPNGSGISADSKQPPDRWSERENLRWKFPIPGRGLSSPVVVGDRVFITYWSGYGLEVQNPGDQNDLKRHLVCIDRRTGRPIWSREVAAVPTERPINRTHGYATHTPVSDGQSVFAFFGQSGVYAFDLDGNRLWDTSVGTGNDPTDYGSASSPIVFENLVIITAACESESIVALDKETGDEAWRHETDRLVGTKATPILVPINDERTDLVIPVPAHLLGLDAKTGEQIWSCHTWGGEVACEGPLFDGELIYLIGGRTSYGCAVKIGGVGDITKTHRTWRTMTLNRISTPLVQGQRLYWVNQGMGFVLRTTDGKMLSRNRASEPRTETVEERRASRADTFSSPVIAGDKLYYVTKSGHAYVFRLGDELVEIAQNQFESDYSDFSASPAISDGDLFIRSQKFLYCVSGRD